MGVVIEGERERWERRGWLMVKGETRNKGTKGEVNYFRGDVVNIDQLPRIINRWCTILSRRSIRKFRPIFQVCFHRGLGVNGTIQ